MSSHDDEGDSSSGRTAAWDQGSDSQGVRDREGQDLAGLRFAFACQELSEEVTTFPVVRRIAADYGWSFIEAALVLSSFFSNLAARSDKLTVGEMTALFREHHLKVGE